MAIKDMLLPEFDQEMAGARKTLERVPEGKPDFKPHEKSMTLARLAGQVAELPKWGVMTLTQDSIDLAPPGGSTFQAMVMTLRAQVLGEFDKNVAEARKALANTSDEAFMKPWSLKKGRPDVDDHAQNCGDAFVCDQPLDSSSRTARRLSAHEQRAGAFALRPIGRRRLAVIWPHGRAYPSHGG